MEQAIGERANSLARSLCDEVHRGNERERERCTEDHDDDDDAQSARGEEGKTGKRRTSGEWWTAESERGQCSLLITTAGKLSFWHRQLAHCQRRRASSSSSSSSSIDFALQSTAQHSLAISIRRSY